MESFVRILRKNKGSLASLEETAWTLNLRGDDVECTPVFLSFMLITSLDATLYVQKASIQDEIVKELENDGIVVEDYFKIYDALENTKNKKVWIDIIILSKK